MKESVRITRFIVIGMLNAAITALVVFLFMNVFAANYVLANVAGYTAALINNFFWCKYWIFEAGKGRFSTEIPLFLLAFGLAYATQFLFLLLMVEVIEVNVYLSQFLSLFAYGAVNFMVNRTITFKR